MEAQEILGFWFKETTTEQWFTKDAKFDKTIETRFGGLVYAAIEGKLDDWIDTDTGALSLVLLLDQFTRNIFRDLPSAFAGDQKALETTIVMLADGYLQRNDEHHRYFMLMPMMHSEHIEIQNASLPLFKKHAPANAYEYAVKHRDIIAKYGRFPHRNSVLGRTSTAEEVTFLTQPGSSF